MRSSSYIKKQIINAGGFKNLQVARSVHPIERGRFMELRSESKSTFFQSGLIVLLFYFELVRLTLNCVSLEKL